MASTVSKKRTRRAPTSTPRRSAVQSPPLDDARLKELMKQAVREVFPYDDESSSSP